jgi:hypothetical protein
MNTTSLLHFDVPFSYQTYEGTREQNIVCEAKRETYGFTMELDMGLDSKFNTFCKTQEASDAHDIDVFIPDALDKEIALQEGCSGSCNTNWADSEIKVISFNTYLTRKGTFNVNGFIYTNYDRFNNERIQEFMEDHASRYDIIGLQEVWGMEEFGRTHYIVRKGKELGFDYYYDAAVFNPTTM